MLNNQKLDVVYSTKLLGIHIESNCKWDENTRNLVLKANPKLWFLRRLKNLGASTEILTEIYKLFVRQSLELAAPLWTSSLTKKNINSIERIQHYATDLILGRRQQRIPYEDRLRELNLKSLEERRWDITLRYARNLSENKDFQYLFTKRLANRTRNQAKFVQPRTFTRRFQVSPIPTYIKLLNQNQTS